MFSLSSRFLISLPSCLRLGFIFNFLRACVLVYPNSSRLEKTRARLLKRHASSSFFVQAAAAPLSQWGWVVCCRCRRKRAAVQRRDHFNEVDSRFPFAVVPRVFPEEFRARTRPAVRLSVGNLQNGRRGRGHIYDPKTPSPRQNRCLT